MGIVLAILTLGTVALTSRPANGHNGYPPECCGGNDCAPVVKVEVINGVKWVHTKHGKGQVGPRTKDRTSPDLGEHACLVAGTGDFMHCEGSGAEYCLPVEPFVDATVLCFLTPGNS